MARTEIELESGVGNKKRATWAEKALAAYLKGKKDEDDIESNILDLLADLFHLAEAKGFDADSLYRKAWDHYEYESKLGKKPA